MTEAPPAPGTWHPYYDRVPGIKQWLDKVPSSLSSDIIAFVEPRCHFEAIPEPSDSVTISGYRTRTLICYRARGFAPYVGDPFVYEWNFTVDWLGRELAGEARIRYGSGH